MHIDVHTMVDHSQPHCVSNELFKGIIADESTAVFNGRVLVRQDAQQINAYQSNRNIVLSDSAKMFSKPELEIYADDVKCSHGATTGQIDDEALFYLRSRGIHETAARNLLLRAFASDVIDLVKVEELRLRLESSIAERLMTQSN
jgi:Fe-S cluster assembly protein SufD